jgi:transcriptional regulator with XRE-family HTH domain
MKKVEIPKHQQKRLEAIGIYLRELRFNEGLSQQELSKLPNLNLHRNTIQRVENGENMTLLTLCELVDAFDIHLNELFLEID